MTVILEATQREKLQRELYIGDSRSGEIWMSLEWKKIMAGYIKKGFIDFESGQF
jgi:hypothetical protein